MEDPRLPLSMVTAGFTSVSSSPSSSCVSAAASDIADAVADAAADAAADVDPRLLYPNFLKQRMQTLQRVPAGVLWNAPGRQTMARL